MSDPTDETINTTPDQTGGSSGSGGQVSETQGLGGNPQEPVQEGDSVAGQPEDTSGDVQEGAQGPDAPTGNQDTGHDPE